MDLPDYIKTEWKGRGHAILEFADSSCTNCTDEFEEALEKRSKELNVSLSASDIIEVGSMCSHVKQVECYISSFNIWEYKEEKFSVDDVLKDSSIKEINASESNIEESESLPPTITTETWTQWIQFWSDWREVYVNLSWVKRYKALCKEDTIEWYDNYCKNYPDFLSYISYYEDIEFDKEKCIDFNSVNIKDFEDPDKAKLLDDLYEEFSNKRYWIHFRLYLRDLNIEIKEDLRNFFLLHGITNDPPLIPVKENTLSESDLKTNKSNLPMNGNLLKTESACTESQQQNGEIPLSDLAIPEGKGNSSSFFADKTSLEGKECNDISPVTLKQDKSKTEAKNKPEIDRSANDPAAEDSPANKTPLETKKKERSSRKQRKLKNAEDKENLKIEDTNQDQSGSPQKKPANRIGIVWAIKHVQELGNQGKYSSHSDGNSPFIFGASETASNSATDLPKCVQMSNAINTDRGHLKRKHKDLELSNSDEHSGDENMIVKQQSNVIVRAVSSVYVSFQYMINTFSGGLFNFIFTLFGIPRGNPWFTFNPFSIPIFWWNYIFSKKEKLILKKFESNQRGSINYLRNIFKPTLRYVPNSTVLSDEKLYLNKVHKETEGRGSTENLIKVTKVDEEDSEGCEKGIYVMYMTEEDIDYELESMVELSHVSPKEDSHHRTLTMFDEEGVAQNVVQVPANEGKMRCMLEEDYKEQQNEKSEDTSTITNSTNEKNFEDWLYSSKISFDEEGNAIAVPVDSSPLHESIRKKIRKILSNSRLVRFSKNDVYSAPEDMPQEAIKYWCQRFRLFLRYDEGIKLDKESWYSVAPEMIAAHQAERLACDTVLDAFCGAGGNAIQLAATCNNVIAIDIDASKIELARHNARIYGVEDRIHFICGDFFKLASSLKADAILLSPPWGGTDYMKKGANFYDLFKMDGRINGKKMMEVAREITPNIAIYLPKSSNIFQLVELAVPDGKLDIEYSHISNKRKSMTAYFGNLVYYGKE